MRDNKGITLAALVVTIVVLIILASVTLYYANDGYEFSQKQAFLSELKIVQAQVNIAHEKIALGNTVYETYGTPVNNLNDATLIEKIRSGPLKGYETQIENYRYFTSTELEKIEARGIKQAVLINYETRDVASAEGIEVDGQMKYRESDFSDENQNIESQYISDGLVLNLSGYDAPESDTWKDRSSSNNDISLSNYTYNSDKKCYTFTNATFSTRKPITFLEKNYTVEIVFATGAYKNMTLGISDVINLKLRQSNENPYWNNLPNTNQRYGEKQNLNEITSLAFKNDYTNKTASKFFNNEKTNADYAETPLVGNKFEVSSGETFNGEIYAIRIYKRALTDNELTFNYNKDKLLYGF